MATDKHHEIDKAVSREIMDSLKGRVVQEVCEECRGDGRTPDWDGDCVTSASCGYCGGTGTIRRQY